MSDFKFKVGEVVRVKKNAKELTEEFLGWNTRMDYELGKEFKISERRYSSINSINVYSIISDQPNFNHSYTEDALEKVCDEQELVVNGIKLEIGKKYDLKNVIYARCNPFKLVLDKNNYGFEKNKYELRFIFLDKDGSALAFSINELGDYDIKEHKEPIKKTNTFYVVFDPASGAYANDMVDETCDLCTDSVFYPSKEDAIGELDSRFVRIAKVEVAVTEISKDANDE